jgi:hypothetical protein
VDVMGTDLQELEEMTYGRCGLTCRCYGNRLMDVMGRDLRSSGNWPVDVKRTNLWM